MRKNLLILISALISMNILAQKEYLLKSPDGTLASTIRIGEAITYDLQMDGERILRPSQLAMNLTSGEILGRGSRIRNVQEKSIHELIPSPFYRTDQVDNHYNELIIEFQRDWSLEFRAYNDGIAYRFVSAKKGPFEVRKEDVNYELADDFQTFTPYVKAGKDGDFHSQFFNSFENVYSEEKLSSLNPGRLAFLPIYVDAGHHKICLTEVNLEGYPGLYLKGCSGTRLEGVNAPYPASAVLDETRQIQMVVQDTEDYIAIVHGEKAFPWRIAIVGREDKDLAASTMSYCLAEPSRIGDTQWIRPGKVAWDWWSARNVYGVDFTAGINTQTYKYHIDFASEYGLEYIILDGGWSASYTDLMHTRPEINLEEIIQYGASKGVGVILWAGFHSFDKDMEAVCRHYAQMGVKGFKVDFMDRDDQVVTEYMYRAAATAAKYHLLIDFHGTYKPAGLNRTYPNAINFEGVNGLEQMKWATKEVNQVRYDCILPFVRQTAGPMDYTPGAMRNATRENFRPVNTEPMSQGTRCHQMALYVVLESPLVMLSDSPTNYQREQECTGFIASVPTVWDETVILDGKIGEYAIIARRRGEDWFIGGITDWEARDLMIDLSFIKGESWNVTLFQDGVNADRKAEDYQFSHAILREPQIRIHLAPGGGFVMSLRHE